MIGRRQSQSGISLKWPKRILAIAVGVVALAGLIALLAFQLADSYIRTLPVQDPKQSLLTWLQPAGTSAPALAPWEATARTDQQSPVIADEFRNPPLRFGPWTRWWWPGNLVDTRELQREMKVFAEAGIAGVEIQPFAISVSETDKASPQWHNAGWDSPDYYHNLKTVMRSAKELGMEVDLNNGSGWPTGGPHVAFEDGLLQLLHSEVTVTGPVRVDMTLPAPAMPVATFGAGVLGMLGDTPMHTFQVDARQLVAVIAARIIDNRRSWQPWDFLDQIAIDVDSVLVITDKVSTGRLIWDAPAGDWVITALWRLPGGELIAGGYAHPLPGYVVDHLDAARMRANQDYLFRSQTGLSPFFGNPLRAFFNDSLEFRQERHWARGHLQEFESRAGYDPRPWLGALIEPGKDQMPFHAANIATAPAYHYGEQGERFTEDWDEVTSQLFRERYFKTLRNWAAEHTLAHRLQAYGGPMDIIRGAGESDIPEAEQLYAGGSEMFLKAVSSGAYIAGKPVVSAESFIFLGRAFMTTPAKIKALADKAFTAGINQLVYHGSAYRIDDPAPRGYPPEEGWYPWQLGLLSADFSEHWEYWEHAQQLNRYIARNQYLLRKGFPETDVLVLYPGGGFPQGYSNPEEPFDQGQFEGEEQPGVATNDVANDRGIERMRAIWRQTRALEQQGLTWAWVNEHALQTATFADGVLKAGELEAHALKLHGLTALSPVVAEHIATLASTGLPVQITGGVPHRQRGLLEAELGDARVRAALSGLASATGFAPGPVRFSHQAIKSLRRRLANGDLLQFFSNPQSAATTLTITVAETHQQPIWLDAWTGNAVTAVVDAEGNLSREFPGYGSATLWLRKESVESYPVESRETLQTVALTNWSLSVAESGYDSQGALPGNWLQIPKLLSSGGPGIYTTTFSLPGDIPPAHLRDYSYHLELGKLYGAAEVMLNGRNLGAVLVPPYTIALEDAIQAGENHLTVTLVPPRKNQLVNAIANGEPGWNAPDIIGTHARVAAGLIGPAKILVRAPASSELDPLSPTGRDTIVGADFPTR